MLIRKATPSDIPDIIGLLKASLGESMIPKSESLWKWKHVDNPFGTSPVLIAEESGQLIGVRAFLRWEILVNGDTISCCRAVDTAIHPDHQGKGLFKKLTLQLIEEIKAEGVDVIFNTPNQRSLPGYIKMGWEKWGKLPLKLEFHLSKRKNKHPLNPPNWSFIEDLIQNIIKKPSTFHQSSPHLQPNYLKWRYWECPLFPYYFLSDGENYIIFYRIKEGKMGRELRISDLFYAMDISEEKKEEAQEKLKNSQKISGARFSSFSGLNYPNQNLISLGSLPILKVGPLVTLREVNDKIQPQDIDWNWSLGTLELF